MGGSVPPLWRSVSDSAPKPTDEELLEQFRSGDAKAFEELLNRYRGSIYNFILRSVRDRERAADLTQETFLRVVQRADSFRGGSKLSTWIFAIARNLCIDHGRRMVFRRHRSLDAPVRSSEEKGSPMVDRVPSSGPVTDRDAIAKELQKRIAEAVEELPEDQREVFLLRQVQGMPFKDIAEVVGVSENTVKSRMRYALERLQGALAEYQDYVRELSA